MIFAFKTLNLKAVRMFMRSPKRCPLIVSANHESRAVRWLWQRALHVAARRAKDNLILVGIMALPGAWVIDAILPAR